MVVWRGDAIRSRAAVVDQVVRFANVALGRRAVTTDTALRLARYFGTSAELWLNLQARHDLDVADRTVKSKIEQEVAPRNAV